MIHIGTGKTNVFQGTIGNCMDLLEYLHGI